MLHLLVLLKLDHLLSLRSVASCLRFHRHVVQLGVALAIVPGDVLEVLISPAVFLQLKLLIVEDLYAVKSLACHPRYREIRV